jgi:DNA-binding IscR family transcriptional regulator
METEKIILEAMSKEGKPVSAGQISEITGIDRKLVDKAMKNLKKEEKIESPKMCFWQPKK